MVRKVKDIILIGEDAKSTKKYLLCIDKIIDDEIERKILYLEFFQEMMRK